MFNIEKPTDEIVKTIETKVIVDLVKITLKDDASQFCIMSQKFVNQDLERIKKMEIYDDDIWVVTYPKCGTTWTQEMIWMLGNNLDYATSLSVKLNDRFPFLEFSGIFEEFPVDTFEICKNMKQPRYIKTHLPLFLLPDQLWTVKPKIIYTARNPKDTFLSWFHHHRHFQLYKGTKREFLNAFVKDLMMYSPMNEHITEFWKIREQPNILFLFFEDMKRNLDQEVKKSIKFLGKNYSEEEVDKLCKHLSFESIRENKMINKNEEVKNLKESFGEKYDQNEFSFIRKGQVGGYKDELTTEENEVLDEYVKQSIVKEPGFEYRF